MKLVSTKTWYGGPSWVLYLKNSAVGVFSLYCQGTNGQALIINDTSDFVEGKGVGCYGLSAHMCLNCLSESFCILFSALQLQTGFLQQSEASFMMAHESLPFIGKRNRLWAERRTA
jgi:hypothetical protein